MTELCDVMARLSSAEVVALPTTMDLLRQLMTEMIDEIKNHRMEMESLRGEMSGVWQEIRKLQTENSFLKPKTSITVPPSPQSAMNHPEGSQIVFLQGNDAAAPLPATTKKPST
jgi:regulator of replication initiation timing